MKSQRTSRDFESLKTHIRALASGKKETPGHVLNWINHLIEVKRLLAFDPGLGQTLTWEEMKGLILIEDCADESSRTPSCPRCKAKATNPFTCTKCGMRLAA